MKSFLVRRWFLCSLALVMAAGFAGPDIFWAFADWVPLRHAIVAGVLFVMALPLEPRAMWRTLRRPQAPALGVAMNYGVLPLLAWALVGAVGPQLLGDELSLGLLVAVATPCTLASAAVWTRRAGGNDAVSIMVTVITNAGCFLLMPFWLLQTTGQRTELDAIEMITRLALVVVLPMTVAQVVRSARAVGRWATRHKTPLGVFAQGGVLLMVFIASVQTAHRLRSGVSRLSLAELLGLLVIVSGIHLAILFLGMWLARLLKCDREDQIAVAFAGSQKTLMVGLQVSMDWGFNIIPMVTYHISQLLIDTVIADRLRARGSASHAAKQEINPKQTQ